ncbi:Uu.00g027260.m01.CDS01 [Anthostomella pinea]|uniref:Uu.00g027260.m01.CDS01 n=1 Tax=Anthostomella pinea TaxID=933095 RepID=A0AAI8V7R1_9PEZI|nr:Uu.00g027260.m01.CDS01 [Anthostomella pinea]
MSSSYPNLTTFNGLSFDCYGTLIDWEFGMHAHLLPLTTQLPASHTYNTNPPHAALRRLNALTSAHERAQPTLPYPEVLTTSLAELAAELSLPPPSPGALSAFGASPGTWVPFADTIAGLQVLKKHYKLIILSNVDNTNIASTTSKQLGGWPDGVAFDAMYTAQDIGNYKPALQNFEYLFSHAKQDLGVDFEGGDLLHVACSLYADHVPAKELGLRSVWISRGAEREGHQGIGGLTDEMRGKTSFEWRFDTIGEFADEVARQFGAQK